MIADMQEPHKHQFRELCHDVSLRRLQEVQPRARLESSLSPSLSLSQPSCSLVTVIDLNKIFIESLTFKLKAKEVTWRHPSFYRPGPQGQGRQGDLACGPG